MAVVRQELQPPDLVDAREEADALRRRDLVETHDVVEADVPHGTDRNDQEVRIVDELFRLTRALYSDAFTRERRKSFHSGYRHIIWRNDERSLRRLNVL